MSPKQLEAVLFKLFGKSYKVKDTKLVYSLRKYCERHNVPFSIVQTLIRHIWKNNPNIYSVYHLNNKQIFALKEKIIPWIEKKNSEDPLLEKEAE